VDEKEYRRKVNMKLILGNQLGWLFKLAETYINSENWKEFVKLHPEVDRFVRRIMVNFHPLNFDPGNSSVDWYIIKGEELASIRKEEYSKGYEAGINNAKDKDERMD